MRIEQLVMYGPTEDERVRFNPRLTVFSGLLPEERRDFVDTLIDAATGRLTNASIVYTDRTGRRIYADSTGATYAETGERAPAPHEMLGQDPATVRALLTLVPSDLGIGTAIDAADLRRQLADARSTLDRRRAELVELRERSEGIGRWEQELDALTTRLERVDDEAARWAWLQLRRRLDGLQAELNLTEQAATGRTDQQMLNAVDALRNFGESWTNLATEVSQLRSSLGPLPAVSKADLELVAATPEELPADFEARFDAWRSATDLRKAADADVARRSAPVPSPDDPLVAAFAALDQNQLWPRHGALVAANEAYEAESRDGDRGELSAETEEAIETAHLAVVRSQNEVDRLFTTGLIAAGALALLALPVGRLLNTTVGAVVLVAAVVTLAVCVVVPRRRLAAATKVEEQALSRADADSWLGLHLRRLDHIVDPGERRRFEGIAKDRAAAQVAWNEIAGAVSPADLTERAAAVRAHAELIDPKLAARKKDEARTFATAAKQAEEAARAALTNGLEPYGFTSESSRDLDPESLTALLDRRIQAGGVARAACHLATIERREQEAAKRLSELLRHLGFEDGTLERRLERTIASVAAARERQASGDRPEQDLRAEIDRLVDELRATARPSWVGSSEPLGPPPAREVLEARQRELAELVKTAGRPDPEAAAKRVAIAESVAAALEERVEHLGVHDTSPQDRLLSRLRRTTALSGDEESVPVIIDDAFRECPPGERVGLLDLLDEMGSSVQIVVLTDDPLATTWARQRSTTSTLSIYEAGPPAPPVTGSLPEGSVRVAADATAPRPPVPHAPPFG